MAYEVTGRVVSDESHCSQAVADASIALFDSFGTLLDETRSDQTGKFLVQVRNPDAAELMTAQLDQADPTVSVTVRVQAAGQPEQSLRLRLPRPVRAREFRVRLNAKQNCEKE
jgi:hypothetical protein